MGGFAAEIYAKLLKNLCAQNAVSAATAQERAIAHFPALMAAWNAERKRERP
jgi:hypothetical protein